MASKKVEMYAKKRYELVIATSKRARQIAMGDEVLTNVKEESPVTLAANEIAEGKVTIIRDDEETEGNENNIESETNETENTTVEEKEENKGE